MEWGVGGGGRVELGEGGMRRVEWGEDGGGRGVVYAWGGGVGCVKVGRYYVRREEVSLIIIPLSSCSVSLPVFCVVEFLPRLFVHGLCSSFSMLVWPLRERQRTRYFENKRHQFFFYHSSFL